MPPNVLQRCIHSFPTLKWCKHVSSNSAEREGGPPKYTALLDDIESELAGTVLTSLYPYDLGMKCWTRAKWTYTSSLYTQPCWSPSPIQEWVGPSLRKQGAERGRGHLDLPFQLPQRARGQAVSPNIEGNKNCVCFYFHDVMSLEFLWRALTITPAN